MDPGLFYDLLSFFILVSLGILAGNVFQLFRLPAITGQIAVGILIGHAGLNLFGNSLLGPTPLHHVGIISEIALGVMTFTVGTHLNLKRMHNAWRRIAAFAFFDIVCTFVLVFLLLTLLTDLRMVTRLLASSIAIATAPGTVISLIQKKQARGKMVKTLLGVVALNNVATIIIFEVVKQTSRVAEQIGWSHLAEPILGVIGALLLGQATGYLLSVMTRHVHGDEHLLAYAFLLVVGNILVAYLLPGFSALLINLSSGVAVGNWSYHNKRIVHVLSGLNELLYTLFFVLAGVHLQVNRLETAGLAGLVFVLARMIGKIGGARLAAVTLRYPGNLGRILGMGLIPQAGLAVGLVISLEYSAFFSAGVDSIAGIVATIVLASVTVNEIIGPFTTSKSFDLAGESGQDQTRLVNFLHEEYILTPLVASNKWEAIEKLGDFLIKTHDIREISRDDLVAGVIEREKEMTTALGNGIALPHARFQAREDLMGVIGILSEPMDFNALDDQPVSILILVATPEHKVQLHLKVCAAVANIFRKDPKITHRMVHARNAAEVYDILQSKEVRDINYFLDEDQ